MLNFRPETWADLVLASDEIERDLHAIAHGGAHDDVLLYGAYGSGKSMLAETLVATRSGRKRSEVEMWRFESHIHTPTQLVDILCKTNSLVPYACEKQGTSIAYLIIDEIDTWNKGEQTRLALYMDDEERHARLLLTTNELPLVNGKLIDRCTTVHVPHAHYSRWTERARQLLASLGITVNNQELEMILSPFGEGASARSVARRLERFIESRMSRGRS